MAAKQSVPMNTANNVADDGDNVAYTILLVDDMRHVREVLRLRLELENGCTIVAEGCDGDQAIELARRHQPDVAATSGLHRTAGRPHG